MKRCRLIELTPYTRCRILREWPKPVRLKNAAAKSSLDSLKTFSSGSFNPGFFLFPLHMEVNRFVPGASGRVSPPLPRAYKSLIHASELLVPFVKLAAANSCQKNGSDARKRSEP